jgi:4-hydroxy-3-methylbut-2-enyl diphosphate reductase
VESKGEIDPEWLKGVRSVGITAGASTPAWVIEEVIEHLTDLEKGGELSGRGVCQTVRGEL